jgi:hypothetical protein
MKKLLIMMALLIGALPLFAQSWEPKDMVQVHGKYEAYIQTFSEIELDLLQMGQGAITGSLNQIKNIKLYTEEGWLDEAGVSKVKKELEVIMEFYNRIKEDSSKVGTALGTWMIFQPVETADKSFLGSLDAVFMKIANEYKNSDLNSALELVKTCRKLQSDYDSMATR